MPRRKNVIVVNYGPARTVLISYLLALKGWLKLFLYRTFFGGGGSALVAAFCYRRNTEIFLNRTQYRSAAGHDNESAISSLNGPIPISSGSLRLTHGFPAA